MRSVLAGEMSDNLLSLALAAALEINCLWFMTEVPLLNLDLPLTRSMSGLAKYTSLSPSTSLPERRDRADRDVTAVEMMDPVSPPSTLVFAGFSPESSSAISSDVA